MTQYIDPILKKYADLVTAKNKEIKKVYYGDPIVLPPKSELPALIVSKVQTLVSDLTNAEDEQRMGIRFTVVTSVMQEFGDEHKTRHGLSTLYDIMEGREESTYELKDTSVLGILRKNASVDVGKNLRTDLGGITRADYGMTVDKRGQGAWSLEGEIVIEAHFIQLR